MDNLKECLKEGQNFLKRWIKEKTGYDNGYNVVLDGDFAWTLKIHHLPGEWWSNLTHKEGRKVESELNKELKQILRPILDLGFKVMLKSNHIEYGCYRHYFRIYCDYGYI